MRDDLRSQNLLPTSAPYAAAATANAGVFAVTGNDAIVDWVLVELRDSTTPATVVTRKSALLQRDGDVVAVDGTSTLTFTVGAPSYYVVVKHRNHLGAMTGSAIALSPATPLVDFTNPVTPTYGTNARRVNSGKALLWSGNANGDGSVIFAGPNNDRNGILAAVLGAPANSSHNANFIITGYRQDDINLDGRTIAAGPGNDINVIGVTVFLHPGNGSGSANYLLAQQLP